jgi:hypothetical protein
VHNPGHPTRRLLRRQQIVLRRMQFKPPAPPAPANESAPIDDPILPKIFDLTPPSPPPGNSTPGNTTPINGSPSSPS